MIYPFQYFHTWMIYQAMNGAISIWTDTSLIVGGLSTLLACPQLQLTSSSEQGLTTCWSRGRTTRSRSIWPRSRDLSSSGDNIGTMEKQAICFVIWCLSTGQFFKDYHQIVRKILWLKPYSDGHDNNGFIKHKLFTTSQVEYKFLYLNILPKDMLFQT